MSLVVVGSVAFDGIETPFGKVDKIIGGSGTYIAYCASYFTKNVKQQINKIDLLILYFKGSFALGIGFGIYRYNKDFKDLANLNPKLVKEFLNQAQRIITLGRKELKNYGNGPI